MQKDLFRVQKKFPVFNEGFFNGEMNENEITEYIKTNTYRLFYKYKIFQKYIYFHKLFVELYI